MWELIEITIYRWIGMVFLILVIAPAGIIFIGYVIYIIVESIKEITKMLE